MKILSDTFYPGLEANKNLVTDNGKAVDSTDFIAGGASIHGVYSSVTTNNALPVVWTAAQDSTTWKDILLPANSGGTARLETPSIDAGSYLIVGSVGVYTQDFLNGYEVWVRVTNGTDVSPYIPVTLQYTYEIFQVPVVMPIEATVNGPWYAQIRTGTNEVSGQSFTLYTETSSTLAAITTDDNDFTKNVPSRLPSETFAEYPVGSGLSSWATSINDNPDPVDHIYSMAFTLPSVLSGNREHLWGVGDNTAAQMMWLDTDGALFFGSGAGDGQVESSDPLTPGATYSVVVFVDATNDVIYLYVKLGSNPFDINVLDPSDDLDGTYASTVHASTGPTDAWVVNHGSAVNLWKTIFNTSAFTGTVVQNLRVWVGQRPQGV